MWKYIELVVCMLAVTAVAFLRLSSSRFFLALDAVVLFLFTAGMLGTMVGDSFGAFAGWTSAIVYLAIITSMTLTSTRRNQDDERKRAWKSWVKGGPYK